MFKERIVASLRSAQSLVQDTQKDVNKEGQFVCARVGNQRSRGVVTARVRIDAV